MSVTARLRYVAGLSCERSFGLYEGWFTIASTSPVCTSSTTTEPACRLRLANGGLQPAIREVLDAQVDRERQVPPGRTARMLSTSCTMRP